MKKSYNQRTPLLALPVLGYNDKILPEVELHKWTVIENLLIAGMQGVKHCVFDEGYWRIQQTADDTYMVSVGGVGHSVAAHGTVGGAYFKADSQIRWEGLQKGNLYWLYLRATQHTMVNPEMTRAAISKHRLSDDSLLMAYVDLRSAEPEINPYPDGKVYSKDIARHANDKENPHGLRLYQQELVVTEKLVLRNQDGTAPTIEVEVDGEAVSLPANMLPGAVAELAGRAVEVIDFESFGPEGGVIEVPNRSKVFNVIVQRRASGKDAIMRPAGEIAVGYFGENEQADQMNEFVVYNSGHEGLPMRATIFCG